MKKMILKTKKGFIIGFGMLLMGVLLFSANKGLVIENDKTLNVSMVKSFTFSSDTTIQEGKIFIPASYETNKNLPVIYLIDYAEQHFKVATDEFEKVIDGVKQIEGFDALVVSLAGIPEIDASPETFQNHYNIFKNLAVYVDSNYANNSSRTLIGRGSEASIILMALFLEDSVFDNYIATDPSPKFISTIENILKNDGLSEFRQLRKFHFSFSTLDPCGVCTELNNLIKQVQYPWLQVEIVAYSENSYENAYPVAYADGIKFVFNE